MVIVNILKRLMIKSYNLLMKKILLYLYAMIMMMMKMIIMIMIKMRNIMMKIISHVLSW